MSKVILLNGSPHPHGCTATALDEMIRVFESEGIETELIQVGSQGIHGCIACGKCMEAGVDDAFFLHLLLRLALLHELVDIGDGNDYEALVVLHSGNPHVHVGRFSVLYPAVGEFENLVGIQLLVEYAGGVVKGTITAS